MRLKTRGSRPQEARRPAVVSGKSICIDLQGISDRAVHCR